MEPAQTQHGVDPSLLRRLRDAYEVLVREALKFGLVGAIGVVVDVGVFNWLLYGADFLHGQPIRAKIVASGLAILVNYIGSRYWTFRHRRVAPVHHEVALFVFFSLVGVGISLFCLGISHYAFGLHSQLADNVSANVIGLPLGTLFRFWSYRRFVFGGEALAPPEGLAHHGSHDGSHDGSQDGSRDGLRDSSDDRPGGGSSGHPRG